MMWKQILVLGVLIDIFIKKRKMIAKVAMNTVVIVTVLMNMNVLPANRFISLVQMIVVTQCVVTIVRFVISFAKNATLIIFSVMTNVS